MQMCTGAKILIAQLFVDLPTSQTPSQFDKKRYIVIMCYLITHTIFYNSIDGQWDSTFLFALTL